jgi:hypothetical protein
MTTTVKPKFAQFPVYEAIIDVSDARIGDLQSLMDAARKYAHAEYDDKRFYVKVRWECDPEFMDSPTAFSDAVNDLNADMSAWTANLPVTPVLTAGPPAPGDTVTIYPKVGKGESVDTAPGLQPWKAKFVAFYSGKVVIDTGASLRMMDPECVR